MSDPPLIRNSRTLNFVRLAQPVDEGGAVDVVDAVVVPTVVVAVPGRHCE
jgi:hypothetical protein